MDQIVKNISEAIESDIKEAQLIFDKAVEGGEINPAKGMTPQNWFEDRFLPNCVSIDEAGYTEMCIDALKIASNVAGTDYGTSRQRDLGHMWADMTRGYLGEFAFKVYLEEKYGIHTKLGHELGDIKEFLPQDIHEVRHQGQEWRSPNIKVGLKAIKWNGIWFDCTVSSVSGHERVFVKT